MRRKNDIVMIIRLKKGKGKPDVLTCIRSDGSTTWTRLRIPAQHDLVHYVVETTLGLRDSFYSLVASGVDITDFEKPKEQQTFQAPTEAVHTEFIVGLLQIEMVNGKPCDDFNSELRSMCEQNGCCIPDEIDATMIDTIRNRIGELLYQWHTTEPGGIFELSFDEDAPQYLASSNV